LLMAQYARQMQRVEILGVLGEDSLVEPLGFRPHAVPVLRQRQLDCRGPRGLRIFLRRHV
jgi:hypothetical protein